MIKKFTLIYYVQSETISEYIKEKLPSRTSTYLKRHRHILIILVISSLSCLFIQKSFAAPTIINPTKISQTKDTSYPGVGYLANSNVVGIWGNNSGTNNPVLVLTPDQNVGIGTTSPPSQYKLAVNGTAIFTRIKVKEYGQWADYVFKKGYRLLPLDSLENYIHKHHHLPGIPSASEVEKGHLDIGEHQSLMLKKIEELTLYIIEQNKKLTAQERRIKELEKKLHK